MTKGTREFGSKGSQHVNKASQRSGQTPPVSGHGDKHRQVVFKDIPVVGIKEAVMYTDEEGTCLDIYMEEGSILSFCLAPEIVMRRVLLHRRTADGNLDATELDPEREVA